MYRFKHLLTLSIAILIFFGVYASSSLSINVFSKTTKELSFEIEGGVEPYNITVAGEKFKMKEFKTGSVKIKAPLSGKYLILARDSEGTVANFEIIIEK